VITLFLWLESYGHPRTFWRLLIFSGGSRAHSQASTRLVDYEDFTYLIFFLHFLWMTLFNSHRLGLLALFSISSCGDDLVEGDLEGKHIASFNSKRVTLELVGSFLAFELKENCSRYLIRTLVSLKQGGFLVSNVGH